MKLRCRSESSARQPAGQKVGILVWLLGPCMLFCGCASMPGPKPGNESISLQGSDPSPVHSTTVLTHTPSQARHFSTWKKLNPIWWVGNADDPVPPPDYRPGKSGRKFTWHFRNPGHNFTFYVLGIADKQFVRSGKYPDQISNPNGGWNFAVCRYKGMELPFVDYRRGRFEFYWGWRERGNLGLKINFAAERKKPAPEVAGLDCDRAADF